MRDNEPETDFPSGAPGSSRAYPASPVFPPGPPVPLAQFSRPPRPRRLNPRPGLALFLFLATCLSTIFAGGSLADFTPEMTNTEMFQAFLTSGLQFSAALMAILIAHEMGHFLQAVRHRVPATLPFFIPMPISPFGTMGAVIVKASGYAHRRALFDIAITGPLAGLVLTIPITWWGMQSVTIVDLPDDPQTAVMIYGDPLLMQWMIEWIHGPLKPGQDVLLNPLLFAGWVGIFITALNLLPIGQLDGGHILYTLIGRPAHFIAVAFLAAAAGYMIFTGDWAFTVLLVLLVLMGPLHPPTTDDTVPLGIIRHLLGWLTLAFLIIGLTPTPIRFLEPVEEPAPQEQQPAPAAPAPPPDMTITDYSSQRPFMNARASVASCSSDSYIRRQIFVAAARSGRARPKASTTIQPS